MVSALLRHNSTEAAIRRLRNEGHTSDEFKVWRLAQRRPYQHAHNEQHDAPDHPDAELKEAIQLRDK